MQLRSMYTFIELKTCVFVKNGKLKGKSLNKEKSLNKINPKIHTM